MTGLEADSRGSLGTVRNAVVLLHLLADGAPYQHLTDLAERSGLSVPTVHRLLRSLSLAGLYLVLRTRSLGRAVLALVPVFLAIGISALAVWALDITLSPLTTVSGPLVVASVAEFSVLIMGRHIEERQDGLGPVDAIHMAARRTGRCSTSTRTSTSSASPRRAS